MSTLKTCPKCSGSMKKSKDLSAIVTASKGIRGYSVKTNRFIPARTYTCQECGYIELYYQGLPQIRGYRGWKIFNVLTNHQNIQKSNKWIQTYSLYTLQFPTDLCSRNVRCIRHEGLPKSGGTEGKRLSGK
jgi:predicted nucleic-acid-binding Zn-ribbon protein